MIILDTNVLSELIAPRPSETVCRWLEAHALGSGWTTVISEAEMRCGVLRLPDGRRKAELAKAVDEIFSIEFDERILALESSATGHYADIRHARNRAGRPISTEDALIAAIARTHDAALATRNLRDFEGCGIDVVNPWTA